MTSADRVALESKIAFLEHTVDELGEVVLDQGRNLEQLLQRLVRIEARLREGVGAVGDEGDPLEERPPHH